MYRKIISLIAFLSTFLISVGLANAVSVSDTLLEGQTKSYILGSQNYEVTLDFVDSDSARFTTNGESTSHLTIGDYDVMADSTIIMVTDILYQDYAGGIHSAEFNLTSYATAITGISDYGVDTDGNGLYNNLVIEVNMNISEPGEYVIYGELKDNLGNWLNSFWEESFNLNAGENTIHLNFNGVQIYVKDADGPYVLSEFETESEETAFYVGYNDLYNTSAYSHTDFEHEINKAPIIESVSTVEEPVRKGIIAEFEIWASDPNNDKLNFIWYVDGEEARPYGPLIEEDIGNYKFIESYLAKENNLRIYVASYSKGDYVEEDGITALYYEFLTPEGLEEFFEKSEGEFDTIGHNENILYLFGGESLFWTYGGDLIAFMNYGEELFNEVVDAYLAKYPSDVEEEPAEEEPIDGVPAEEEEPIDGVPAEEEEPIDGVPAEEEEPIDGVPAEEEEPIDGVPIIMIQESYFTYYANKAGAHEIKVVASDGEFETEHTWNVNAQENGLPTIDTYFPAKNPKITEDGTQLFSITKSDPDNDELQVKWYLNDALVSESDSYTHTVTGTGTFTIRADVSDGIETVSHSWTLTASDRPVADTFDGSTTDFSSLSQSQLANLSNVVLEKSSYGRIDFGSNALDFSNIADIDSYVSITDGIVAIDTNSLPAFNVPTRITMYGLAYTETPIIYSNEGFSTNPSDFTSICPVDLCSNINYTPSTGILKFDVAHFSSYKSGTGNKLKIADVDVKVDGSTDKNLGNGNRISKEAEPGSTVEFKVEIENLYTREEDVEIKDIEVQITIEDINDGDDLEEDADEFDLDADDKDSVKLKFKIPLEVDEGDYDVIVSVEGRDKNGTIHELKWNLELEVDKEKHNVVINKFSLNPSTVSCERESMVNAELINLGSEDEDGVALEITNNELGIFISQKGIGLEEGTDGNKYEKSFRAAVEESAGPGTYTILINTYYDTDKLSDAKTFDLVIQGCERSMEVKEGVKSESAVELQTVKSVQEMATKPATSIHFADTSEYVALLIILNVLLMGLIIFAAGYFFIRIKR